MHSLLYWIRVIEKGTRNNINVFNVPQTQRRLPHIQFTTPEFWIESSRVIVHGMEREENAGLSRFQFPLILIHFNEGANRTWSLSAVCYSAEKVQPPQMLLFQPVLLVALPAICKLPWHSKSSYFPPSLRSILPLFPHSFFLR